jgi:outer membrane receptor for ferrienterochelin and colicin
MNSRSTRQASVLRRSSLALALAMGMGLTGTVFAQATTGSLFGSAEAGDTVQITSSTGVSRSTTVGATGRYTFNNLPIGTYKVSLVKGGATVDSRENVELKVNAGTEVSFNAPAAAAAPSDTANLEAVTVTGTALPPIDVSAVDSRTVITQSQLKQLPLTRSSEAIALLAPGVTPGATGTGFQSATGQALVAFGGSSINENAYYVNGMNTTDPIGGYGGIQLPYGAIDQEEVLTGGYSAAYGRSTGGVINIVGRRGTNDWHFGAQILWTPEWGKADPTNYRYVKGSPKAGQLYRTRENNKDWDALVSGYAGGPLIKDKLFVFAAAEAERRSGESVGSVNSGQQANYTYRDPKTYLKVDWNITDNNLLELTHASSKDDYSGSLYDYDYTTNSRGGYIQPITQLSTKQDMWIAKFTSYITDTLTLSAQYGRQKIDYYSRPAGDQNQLYIYGADFQDPAYTGGSSITNSAALSTVGDPAKEAKGSNYRVDLNYTGFDGHSITVGIDNQSTQDRNDGELIYANAGYAWEYGAGDPGADIIPGQVAGTASGYYVDQYRYNTVASVAVKQRAQYIEDKWQVNDRWLLSLGLRNDQFTNYNGSGEPYINQHKPQWAPRLGASWDVFGDSTFKVYANAGRYYLALPNQPALRGASGSYYTRAYYSYDGIDPTNGYPINPQPLATVKGPGGEFASNNEYGTAPDPRTVTAKGIKPEYQDEFILGFDKTLGDEWVYGAKATYRKLRNAIDDFCDTGRIQDKSAALGNNVDNENWDAISCYLFNPGRANTFAVPNTATGGFDEIKVSNAELGFPHLKRSYYALNLHLEHPQGNGKWWGRIDYTYSRSYGNSEGQVDSDAGDRSAASTTQAWDAAQFMEYANGYLPNDRKHQLKIFGSYQFTPEFSVAGNIQMFSGAPRNCFGGYGPDQVGVIPGYGTEAYHWCDGHPSRPGDAGRTPWVKTLNLSAQYRPEFADHKLAFSLDVFNVTNEQKATQVSPYYNVTSKPDPAYGLPLATQTPRYIRLGATYDF